MYALKNKSKQCLKIDDIFFHNDDHISTNMVQFQDDVGAFKKAMAALPSPPKKKKEGGGGDKVRGGIDRWITVGGWVCRKEWHIIRGTSYEMIISSSNCRSIPSTSSLHSFTRALSTLTSAPRRRGRDRYGRRDTVSLLTCSFAIWKCVLVRCKITIELSA